mmetsp:Transcript_8241/g.34425  ORF Transcript_8241/g.34425 Transcript_8241/m.34425 type:complete len:217 (+) Transcript_8241:499-1149(+)
MCTPRHPRRRHIACRGSICFTRTFSPTPTRKPSGSCSTPRSTPRSTRRRFRTISGTARRTARARSTRESTRGGTCCGSRGETRPTTSPTISTKKSSSPLPRSTLRGPRKKSVPIRYTTRCCRSASCTRRSRGTSGTSPGTCCTCTSCGTGNPSTGSSRSRGRETRGGLAVGFEPFGFLVLNGFQKNLSAPHRERLRGSVLGDGHRVQQKLETRVLR